MAPITLADSADSKNKFEDLSGIDITKYANPYDALIKACHDEPSKIQSKYATHRETRNSQQKAKILASDFQGMILDPVLQKLENFNIESGFEDPRHCLVFWARPPQHIKDLVVTIQQKLLTLAPKLWLMPQVKCHLTALEITHSLTSPEITSIINQLGNSTISTMTNYPLQHRARLIKPALSYDAAAIALSFLPASRESLASTPDPSSRNPRTAQDDAFTYHHLRQSLFNIAHSTGVSIDSRYVVPSSHITVGRFITQEDHDTPEKRRAWINLIEEVNAWLKAEFWPQDGCKRNEDGEWVVGQEKGLDCRRGQLWYGGGETVMLGKGF